MHTKNILITGHQGFIGSCLLKSIYDEWSILPYTTKVYTSDYDNQYKLPDLSEMDIVIHMGAISSTNSTDREEIFDKNVMSTINIIEKAKNAKIIYASSASTYGPIDARRSEDDPLRPQSLYAVSKAIIDDVVLNYFPHRKIVGLRFFNVCSFNFEGHKKQPSPTFSFLKQLRETGQVKLFFGSKNIFRDFIYIEDVIDIVQYFLLKEINHSIVVNVGSGKPVSFEQIADKMIDSLGFGEKVYVERPVDILKSYQTYTHASLDYLRGLGYTHNIPSILDYIEDRIS